jgi:acyl-CoA synthetase
LGGDSISAAHVAHKLEIDMRLIYIYPTPSKLLHTLPLSKTSLVPPTSEFNNKKRLKVSASISRSFNPISANLDNNFHGKGQTKGEGVHDHVTGSYVNETTDQLNSNMTCIGKYQEKDICSDTYSNDGSFSSRPWVLNFYLQKKWSISRCNRFMDSSGNLQPEDVCSYVSYKKIGHLLELWSIPLDSCVDASPLLVMNNEIMNIFIGSHSHLFLCIDGRR